MGKETALKSGRTLRRGCTSKYSRFWGCRVLKKPKGNLSERTLEIPADLTDSRMRTEKELSWRTQPLHLEYKPPNAHGKVGKANEQPTAPCVW